MDVIEKMARAIWNTEVLPAGYRGEFGTDTRGMQIKKAVYVLWDDVDMLDRDRAAMRAKARAALTALADNVSDVMVLVFGQVAAEGLATPEEVAKKFHESSEADKVHLRRAISAAIRAASQPTGEA